MYVLISHMCFYLDGFDGQIYDREFQMTRTSESSLLISTELKPSFSNVPGTMSY